MKADGESKKFGRTLPCVSLSLASVCNPEHGETDKGAETCSSRRTRGVLDSLR